MARTLGPGRNDPKREPDTILVEGNAPAEWTRSLAARGHRTETTPPYDSAFGHAHVILRDEQGFWSGAADPRARVGSVAGA